MYIHTHLHTHTYICNYITSDPTQKSQKVLLLSTSISQEIAPILLTIYCSNLPPPFYSCYCPSSDTHQLMSVSFQKPLSASSFTLSNKSIRLLPVTQNAIKQVPQQEGSLWSESPPVHTPALPCLLNIACLHISKPVQMKLPLSGMYSICCRQVLTTSSKTS